MNEKRRSVFLLELARWIAVALLAGFVFLLSGRGAESSASFDAVAAAVTAAADTEPMREADNQMIRRLYGLDPADYDGVLCLVPASSMGAEEIFLVRLASLDQQETAAAAVTARRDGQRAAFDGYGIEQCDMLDRSVIEVRGSFILFVSAADPQPVADAFLGAIREG